MSAGAGSLPELAAVPWRGRADAQTLRRAGRWWTLSTLAHSLPFALASVVLGLLSPVTLPVGLILLVHGLVIPELYVARGAKVLLPRRRGHPGAEATALGLLGDLVGHDARELHRRTGLIVERGRFGVWLVGEAGAVLIAPGGRRIFCMCVRVPDPTLPAGDRTAHLLLALREDEAGFVTVANLAFSGHSRRLRRRLQERARPALDHGLQLAAARAAAGPQPRPSLPTAQAR